MKQQQENKTVLVVTLRVRGEVGGWEKCALFTVTGVMPMASWPMCWTLNPVAKVRLLVMTLDRVGLAHFF